MDMLGIFVPVILAIATAIVTCAVKFPDVFERLIVPMHWLLSLFWMCTIGFFLGMTYSRHMDIAVRPTTEIDLSARPIGWYYAILAEILLLTILLCAHRLKGIIQESNLDGQRKRERSQPADHD